MRIAVRLTGALIVSMLAVSQASAVEKTRTKSNNTNERVEPSAQGEPASAEPVQALKNRTKSNNANERAMPSADDPAAADHAINTKGTGTAGRQETPPKF